MHARITHVHDQNYDCHNYLVLYSSKHSLVKANIIYGTLMMILQPYGTQSLHTQYGILLCDLNMYGNVAMHGYFSILRNSNFPIQFQIKVESTIMLKKNKKQTRDGLEAHEMRHWDGISEIIFRSYKSTKSLSTSCIPTQHYCHHLVVVLNCPCNTVIGTKHE